MVTGKNILFWQLYISYLHLQRKKEALEGNGKRSLLLYICLKQQHYNKLRI